MSQQDFDIHAPRAKSGEDSETLIPFAGIHAQTRGGKDELITGAAPMVWDSGNSVYVPADQSNPLHVKAKALEDLIGALDATKETNPDAASATQLALLRGLLATLIDGTQKVQLSGSKALDAAVVTPDDDADLPGGVTAGLYVGTSGKVTVDLEDSTSPVTFVNLASGGIHPLRVKRVYATDTDALNIVAVY